jgi:2-oxoglutarate ferredoxin oxidoreductase subunit delta
MRPRIDPEYCKGCDLCVKVCPRKVYDRGEELSERGYMVPIVSRPQDCLNQGRGSDRLACDKCMMTCPDRAIDYVEDE